MSVLLIYYIIVYRWQYYIVFSRHTGSIRGSSLYIQYNIWIGEQSLEVSMGKSPGITQVLEGIVYGNSLLHIL